MYIQTLVNELGLNCPNRICPNGPNSMARGYVNYLSPDKFI